MKNVKLYSDTLALDLQRFAIDNTEGLVGTGTKLERSSDGTTWEEFADIKTIPELGGDTEKVDVTTLADDRRKQVEGIQNASNVQFQVVYPTKIGIIEPSNSSLIAFIINNKVSMLMPAI